MERWVAIALGVAVVVIGFILIQNIGDAQAGITDTGDDLECLVNGGSCVETCSSGNVLSYSCGEGRTCCQVSGDE